jgi:hypothetical protein
VTSTYHLLVGLSLLMLDVENLPATRGQTYAAEVWPPVAQLDQDSGSRV